MYVKYIIKKCRRLQWFVQKIVNNRAGKMLVIYSKLKGINDLLSVKLIKEYNN